MSRLIQECYFLRCDVDKEFLHCPQLANILNEWGSWSWTGCETFVCKNASSPFRMCSVFIPRCLILGFPFRNNSRHFWKRQQSLHVEESYHHCAQHHCGKVVDRSGEWAHTAPSGVQELLSPRVGAAGQTDLTETSDAAAHYITIYIDCAVSALSCGEAPPVTACHVAAVLTTLSE